MESPADSTWRGYSIAERDRRWSAVRAGAAAAGFDCLFVPLGNGLDASYLTQMENAAFVLPTDGRAPIAVNDRGRSSAWVQDVRATNRSWPRPMTQALMDAGMERARIGVVGLRGGSVSHVRAPDGCLVHSAYAEVVRALPNATFEDATDVVGMSRYVKSEEEITCLRHSAAIAEAGVDTMVELARPGLDEAELYAAVMHRMLELGSAYYPLALYAGPIGGPEPARFTRPPIGRRLGNDWIITNEVCAIWGGMVSQEDQPIVLGRIPEAWKPVLEMQREVWEAGLAFMKPGVTFGELIDYTNGYGAKHSMRTRITLHGRGLGDDGPLITSRASGERIRSLPLEVGNCWVWKPYAAMLDGSHELNWGGDVVVTADGGQRLFDRPHRFVAIE